MKRRIGELELDAIHAIDCVRGLRALPDACIDVVVTSPPYWGQRGSAGLGTEPDPRDYLANLVAILADAMRVLKPSGTLWLNLGDAYNTPINWREADHQYSTLGADRTGLAATNSAYTKNRGRRRAFLDAAAPWLTYGNLLALPYRIVIGLCDRGALFRGEVIWEKTRPMPEGRCRRPHRRHEGIYVFARGEAHAFQTTPPIGTLWRLVQQPNATAHSSTFPIDLPRQCIVAAAAPPGSIVLDPFMGSGTTAVAAKELGCQFLGFELDPAVAKSASARASGAARPPPARPARPPRSRSRPRTSRTPSRRR